MSESLKVSLGQASSAGVKTINQDFHGAQIPAENLLCSKGVAIALADGISSSEVSQVASETSVVTFLNDYLSTPETWSVKNSAIKVLDSINSWLYAQSLQGPNRFDLNKGYVCTFSGLIIKSRTLHLFHVGDSRVYYYSKNGLEQLTKDHRIQAAPDKSYLSRALGMQQQLSIDYHRYPLEVGDTLLLATDGIYEFIDKKDVDKVLQANTNNLDNAAKELLAIALNNGSDDNATVQLLRVDSLPEPLLSELAQQAKNLPLPPPLEPRSTFDGYYIKQALHHSNRSHVYLAEHTISNEVVALKIPAVDFRTDPVLLEQFLLEDWLAKQLNSPHVIKAVTSPHPRRYLYTTSEYIKGQTLHQWIVDNPQAPITEVREFTEQIAKGLNSLHRQEIVHQDLRPQNIMVDMTGTLKIIDLGSAKVAGIDELSHSKPNSILGTAQYSAPEYFLGDEGSPQGDIYSLGVITYQMLTGMLPYGPEVSRATTRAAQQKLQYQSARLAQPQLPHWVDSALRKAVHPDPKYRYQLLSEFIYDLRNPNPTFASERHQPLIEKNPLLFWKGLSLALAMLVIYLMVK